jgi:phage tail-like protein
VRAISTTDARVLVGDPVAIDVAGDELVVVLDRHGGTAASTIRLYDPAMTELGGSPRSLAGFDRRFVAHDMAVVQRRDGDPDDVFADLLITDVQGDQAYRFTLTRAAGALAAQPDFYPMRSFGGRGLVGTPDGGWYDFADRWILLVLQPRPQFVERAVLVSEVFDSGIPDCIWHRLLLDGSLSPRAGLIVSSAASDDRADLDHPSWNDEPSPYRRGNGSERPFAGKPHDARSGTNETLFQAARGRYLRLRLELFGDRQTSPRIRSLRAYYPRFSYLEQYLPAVYREDERSAHFLDGFLANFEGFYTVIEDRIAGHEVLLDPRTAPVEALDWLASWFEVVLDPGWDEDRRRLLIRHAVDLFRWRGTERGLRMALGLALLACPDDRLFAADGGAEPGGIRIVERYQTKRASPAVLGDPIDQAVPRETTGAARWTPADGGDVLKERYASYVADLVSAGVVEPLSGRRPVFAPTEPTDGLAPPWLSFCSAVLGFVPSATFDDQPRWEAFLRRRYPRVEALAAAHRRPGSTYEEIGLPERLPADGPPLSDWFVFESVVLPGVRAAHRFSVLLPVPIGRATRGTVVRASDARDRMAEQLRVARLVELEKPAHTVFDVKSFWLAFRLGEARLGKDTLLDYGSRSPDLRPPAVLGSMHVGESVLTSAMADLPDRPAVFSGSVDAAGRRVARRTDG